MEKKEPKYVFHPGVMLVDELDERSEKCKTCGHIKNYTQEQFAKDADINNTALSAIIRGRRRIGIKTAKKIAKVLGTSWEMWFRMQQDYDVYKENNKTKSP